MTLPDGMPCPVCLKEGKTARREKWIHGDHCGGEMILETNGRVYCSKCGYSAPAISIRYSCSNGHSYSYASVEALADAISMSGIINTKYRLRWFQDFLNMCR